MRGEFDFNFFFVCQGFGLSDDWLGVTWGWSTAARGKLQDRWTDPKKMQSDISQGVTQYVVIIA